MVPEPHLDEVLRALAGHGRQGRVPAAADVRRRGDTRRRRRQAASVTLAAVLVGLLGAGAVLARPSGDPDSFPSGRLARRRPRPPRRPAPTRPPRPARRATTRCCPGGGR
ncbi:hypothetical protein [Verrucosispora sioxanthis]|uniref:hypothetical protein n=1 Tax=Verrucosispora sioxanthis TaxID=2499994 RepID=UPI001F44B078|nr:hypothetical protein [Verrucosispora sioxanthis]